MALPDDLNMPDVQLARLCRKQDAEIEGLRTELSLTQAVNMAQATEIDKLRAALKPFVKARQSIEVGDLSGALSVITVGDLRRACAAFGDEQKADDK